MICPLDKPKDQRMLFILSGFEVANFEHPKSVFDLGQRDKSSIGRFSGVSANEKFQGAIRGCNRYP